MLVFPVIVKIIATAKVSVIVRIIAIVSHMMVMVIPADATTLPHAPVIQRDRVTVRMFIMSRSAPFPDIRVVVTVFPILTHMRPLVIVNLNILVHVIMIVRAT
jgi:hypothetical protein